MAFDWNEYMKLASELRETKQEAYMRSAISRSYYGAYNIARSYLKAKKRDWQIQEHTQLWSQVGRVSRNIEIQTLGQRVRKIRRKADYDFDFPDVEAQLTTAMMNSAQIIHLIKQLNHDPEPIVPDSTVK
jgi:hypothetical protein